MGPLKPHNHPNGGEGCNDIRGREVQENDVIQEGDLTNDAKTTMDPKTRGWVPVPKEWIGKPPKPGLNKSQIIVRPKKAAH